MNNDLYKLLIAHLIVAVALLGVASALKHHLLDFLFCREKNNNFKQVEGGEL